VGSWEKPAATAMTSGQPEQPMSPEIPPNFPRYPAIGTAWAGTDCGMKTDCSGMGIPRTGSPNLQMGGGSVRGRGAAGCRQAIGGDTASLNWTRKRKM